MGYVWGKAHKVLFKPKKVGTKNKAFSCLITADGSEITSNEEILVKDKKFYEKLYSQEPSRYPIQSVSDLGLTNEQIPQLSESSKIELDREYSMEDLRKALGDLNRGKCPGFDGLTVEFFTFFWEGLAPFYAKSLHHSLNSGLMSVE